MWRRRGAYVERAARPVLLQLDPYWEWIAKWTFAATVLNHALCQQA
jgi:hypothetical protein